MADSHTITTTEELEKLYDKPYGPSLMKEIDHINAHYRALIEAAPFVAIATSGPDGLDCSPKGDMPGFVRVADEKTVMIPDRRGNNRLDSMHNLIDDPRIALLFLIPGVGETLRINGRAAISTDPQLCASFTVQGKAPRAVYVITVERIYFHCSKAIVRSKLWDPASQIDRKSLPSTGTMVADLSKGAVVAETYDREAPERIKAQLY